MKNPESNTTHRGTILFLACFTSFITPFMGSSVNLALPSIARDFGANAVVISWVASSFVLSSAMFLVPFGKYADIRGRKKVFLWGNWIFTLSSLLCTVSWSAHSLIAFRILQGLGSAMIFGTGIAILVSVFPPELRGRVLGISVSFVYIGLALGPSLGGFIISTVGWRGIFFITVPLGATTILLVYLHLKGEWLNDINGKFDLQGSVLFCIGIAALMYGLSLIPTPRGFLIWSSGILVLIVFTLVEIKTPFPVFDVRLLANNRVFAFSNLSALIHYSATFAISFFISLYLQYIKDLSPKQAGMIMISQPVMMALFSPLAGRLSDRIEPRLVASGGMFVTACGIALCTMLTDTTSVVTIVTVLLVIGIGFAFFSSPNTNAVMSSVDRRTYGLASGTLGTMRLTGQMFSMGIATVIMTVYIGQDDISPARYGDFLDGMRSAFFLFTIFCVAGVFTSIIRGKLRTKENGKA